MATCPFPMTIKNRNYIYGVSIDYSHHLVPCGKCPICMTNRSNAWTHRISYELKDASSAYFVTLTYENPPRSYNDLATLRKGDLQGYFKRLRKHEKNNTYIKYYAAGEYGSEFHRPHYHAIILNVNDERNLFRAWTINDKVIGIVDVGDVTPASIAYVTGYIGKKIGIPWTDYDDRLPEFSLMSKKMGLNYLTYAKNFHLSTQSGFTRIGKTLIPLPRYLKEKIFDKNTLKLISYENYIRFLETKVSADEARLTPIALAKHRAEAYEHYAADSSFVNSNLS